MGGYLMEGKGLVHERLAAEHQWDDFANRFETRRRLQIVFEQLLGDHQLIGRRFLDAGSGGGHFSAAAVQAGAEVWSCDVGENLLEQVAERCQSHRLVGSVLDLPFPDEFFDVVLCTEVIEHTPEPLGGLRELCRVVALNGALVVTTPCRLWQPVVRAATFLRLRPYDGYENFSWPGDHVRTIVRAGLEIEQVKGFNFCPLFWEPLGPAFRFMDIVVGRIAPWLMVNIAVRARRPNRSEGIAGS